jgi:hypothetical protein
MRNKRKPLNTTNKLAPMSANTAIHMLAWPLMSQHEKNGFDD